MKLVMNQGHEHPVFGKMIRAGETFDAPENEVTVWIKSGRARIAPTRTIQTKVEEAQESEPVEEKERKSGRYNRRDMRAEEK